MGLQRRRALAPGRASRERPGAFTDSNWLAQCATAEPANVTAPRRSPVRRGLPRSPRRILRPRQRRRRADPSLEPVGDRRRDQRSTREHARHAFGRAPVRAIPSRHRAFRDHSASSAPRAREPSMTSWSPRASRSTATSRCSRSTPTPNPRCRRGGADTHRQLLGLLR